MRVKMTSDLSNADTVRSSAAIFTTLVLKCNAINTKGISRQFAVDGTTSPLGTDLQLLAVGRIQFQRQMVIGQLALFRLF